MKNLALFIGIILSVVVSHQAFAQITQYNPTVGQPHPDFILPTVENGEPVQLSDFRGKKVLLMHFASW